MNFDEAFDILLGHEGAYSNHPSDPGGETMWGITVQVARANFYTGEMRHLPRETAKAIYRKRYWDAVKADQLPLPVRYSVFDAAVNSGAVQAAKWLQRALGVRDDGVIGPITLKAAHKADGLKLAIAVNVERLEFMTGLATWGHFSRGWARRIAANLKGLL